MAKSPEKGNAVLNRYLSKIRHNHVNQIQIYVGMGSCSIIAGAEKTKKAIEDHIKKNNIKATIIDVGCIGLCTEEPIVDIQIPGRTRISFARVTPNLISEIIDAISNNLLPDVNILGQYPQETLSSWKDVPAIYDHYFFKSQYKFLTARCGKICPENIDDYIASNGYKAFAKAITTHTSEEICNIIIDSELKGRSGSAYPTGKKWLTCLKQTNTPKYFICNADESDPGSFVDRHLVEGDPHEILEGIAIGAYAIQSSKAIIYIRNKYSLAIKRLKIAIEQANDYGLLGENIFNSGYNLNISIKIGPGAHVCGEETALIASLEGKRGMPESKPPYPSEKGLFGKPTIINNVETLSNIPIIIRNGSEWFKTIGTHNSKGTKLFSVSGKIAKTGVVEVVMGTKIRAILQTCGGVPGEKDLKAVHIGGPSGGIINTNNIDLPIDFVEMKAAGLRMGSGSFLVLNEDNCILALAKYFMKFIQQESCGKCIPCREGSQRILEILERITQKQYNESKYESLERFKGVMQLENLSNVMMETSLCGLGRYAPGTILTSLKYFRDEYEEHIFDRKCRAGVCKGLKTYIIDVDKCIGCTVCAKKCPVDAIIGTARNPFFIVQEKCIGCGTCYEQCKFNAISIK